MKAFFSPPYDEKHYLGVFKYLFFFSFICLVLGVLVLSPEWKKNQIEAHLHSYRGTDTDFSITLAIEQ